MNNIFLMTNHIFNSAKSVDGPRTAESVRFFREDTGIHGPPIWSDFFPNGCLDPRTVKSVRISKGECRDPRTADLVRFLEGDAGTHKRPNRSKIFQGNTGIYGPPICSGFLKGGGGSMDGRISPILKKRMQRSTDG